MYLSEFFVIAPNHPFTPLSRAGQLTDDGLFWNLSINKQTLNVQWKIESTDTHFKSS
jgi:hypothetical protein